MNSSSVIQLLAIGAGLLLTAQFTCVWLVYCILKYILPLLDKRRAGRLDDRKIMKEMKRK